MFMNESYPLIDYINEYNLPDDDCIKGLKINTLIENYNPPNKPLKEEFVKEYYDGSTAYVFIPLGVFLLGIALSNDNEESGAAVMMFSFLVGYLSFKIHQKQAKEVNQRNKWRKESIENKYANELKKYNDEIEKIKNEQSLDLAYNKQLDKFESISKKRFLHRLKVTREKFSITDSKIGEGVFIAKKGLTEEYFLNFLASRYPHFKDKLHQNNKVEFPNVFESYFPDICFIDEKYYIYIDIEIDERYTLNEKISIHNIDDDLNRNCNFVSAGWIVIRFTEDQIILDPIGCAETIHQVIRNAYFGKRLKKHIKTFQVSMWSIDDYFDNNFRDSHIKLIKKWQEGGRKYQVIGNMIYKYAKDIYRDLDLNTTCIISSENEYNKNSRSKYKHPSHKHDELFFRKQTDEEFKKLNWEKSCGVGTLAGYNDLLVIDIDEAEDDIVVYKILLELGLDENYQWVVNTGSRKGFHILLKCKKPNRLKRNDVCITYENFKSTDSKFGQIQLLFNTHVVLPPSLHKSGNRYSFKHSTPVNAPKEIETDKLFQILGKFIDLSSEVIGKKYIN
ncbi:hypothetical protein CEQ90_19715 [Lewinellaceae bacterium SD302]|nr:hypothetical protein CEQ90_19715 [Lewinellaceae bacterium SD302]